MSRARMGLPKQERDRVAALMERLGPAAAARWRRDLGEDALELVMGLTAEDVARLTAREVTELVHLLARARGRIPDPA